MNDETAVSCTVNGCPGWSMRPGSSPVRCPGGKRKLAALIGDLLIRSGMRTELLVEPFAGGSAVSIALLEAWLVDRIGLADIDPLISSFWQTVFSPEARALIERILEVDITLDEWDRQRSLEPATPLDAAFKCLFLNRTSFSGVLKDGAGPIGGRAQSGKYRIN